MLEAPKGITMCLPVEYKNFSVALGFYTLSKIPLRFLSVKETALDTKLYSKQALDKWGFYLSEQYCLDK